jgi:alkanesulfonate monooxygenase SsuD/methylene tetrahydromethanopterin reductase-like flavin-dependent oxidoreductase (luciferase family)
VPCFLRAVTLDREMGNRYDLAMVLAHLGETYAATGDLHGAREAWDESLLILRTLHHPSAVMVRRQLATLESGQLTMTDPTGALAVPVSGGAAGAGAA